MPIPSGRSALSTFSSSDERRTILHDWNDTARAIPSATLPELFAAQVAKTPDATAVVFEDERLTYRELDARSNQLAHHLRALGVGPEVVVGLCVERSLEMLIGLIGILKAGGAYLPLDPDYPPERLAFMLDDAQRAGAAHALRRCSTQLPQHRRPHRAPRCRLARPSRRSRQPRRPSASIRKTPPTSSTRRAPPEPRRASASRITASANLSSAQMADFPMRPGDRVLGAASISFDASIEQKFLPLLQGACVVLMADLEMQEPSAFWDFVSRHAVNYLDTTPSLLAAMIEAAPSRCRASSNDPRRRGSAAVASSSVA